MDNTSSKKGSGNVIFIIIIVVLLVALGGIFYYYHKKVGDLSEAAKSAMMAVQKKPAEDKMAMSMIPVTPPAMSDQQTQQLAAVTKKKTFNITGGNFYFVPNKITVKKGDEVTFVMTNAGGFHNLKIDELQVKTSTIKTGETTSITFTPTKVGSFVYYCGVPGHRAKGMWGTLVVE